MLFLIAGVSLAILGVLAYIISQMPDSPIKRKKAKRVPPPEPPKDWEAIAERHEKRAQAIEARLRAAEAVVRDRDKEIVEHKAAIGGLERQFQQEQIWRKKEEDFVEKEKTREKLLEAELNKTRDSLNTEMTSRIKLEYEVKELRTVKESTSADARHLSSQNMEQERKIKTLTDENRELKRENAQLKVKKEANQWIAKDDYIRVEKLLKRARWEVDLFKRKFAEDLWPREMQTKTSKQAVTSDVDAGTPSPSSSDQGDQPGPGAAASP